MFQFLIGRLKTWLPYQITSSGIKFQFLIGRLKTTRTFGCTCWLKKFQFLIGRLKTQSGNNKETVTGSFQFLIGRLKTWHPVAKQVCHATNEYLAGPCLSGGFVKTVLVKRRIKVIWIRVFSFPMKLYYALPLFMLSKPFGYLLGIAVRTFM